MWFRIETRLLRLRQFAGLDVYWFGADRSGDRGRARRIVQRAGAARLARRRTRWRCSQAGPDRAVVCHAADTRRACDGARACPSPAPPDLEGDLTPEPFHTPGQKTIADLARFTGQPESMQMKSLVLVADGKPVLVMLRGDHQLSEAKFAAKCGRRTFRQATAEELVSWFGASAGSLGPVGVKPCRSGWIARSRAGATWSAAPIATTTICGTSRPARTSRRSSCDLREAAAGDACAGCAARRSNLRNAVELARIRRRRRELSLDRLLTTAVEPSNDKDGMILPAAIAPFDVIVTAPVDPAPNACIGDWRRPESTCCSTIATSVRASNSRTRT